MKIRIAKRSDVEAIYHLVVQLAIFEKEPDAVTSTLEDYLTSFDNGLIEALVATEDSQVIGMALYYMTFSTWKGKMLYLEDFYVKEKYRSLGTGQQLFDAFINVAKAKGCSMVKWQVLDWNKAAIKFYKRNGATIEDHWYNGKVIF